MLSNTAIEPSSTPKQGRPCCLTIRRNAIKLKRGSRRRRKRLKMPTRPGRTMSPRLGLFEKRLQDCKHFGWPKRRSTRRHELTRSQSLQQRCPQFNWWTSKVHGDTALASTFDDTRIGLRSFVRPTVPPSRPDIADQWE